MISASAGAYGNTVYCLDDGGVGYGSKAASALTSLTNEGVAASYIYYGPPETNTVDITSATNVTAYWTKGTHGHTSYYDWPLDGTTMVFHGSSSWYIMTTLESFNGQRYYNDSTQSSFVMWFAQDAFGGTNYSNTPVCAVSHVDEPDGAVGLQAYYGLWALGKSFAICARNSSGLRNNLEPNSFQAVGDPFVTK